MSSVDDGLKIKLEIDTKDAENNINNLDETLQQSLVNITRNLDGFKKNLTDVFDVLQNKYEQSLQDGENASRLGKDVCQKQQDNQNKELQNRKQQADYDRKKQEDMKQQLEQSRQLVNSFKDMGVALTGVVTVGLSLRKALDFSDNLTKTGLHLKAIGMHATDYFETRNVLRKRGIEDGTYMAALNDQKTIYDKLMTSRMEALDNNQRIALSYLAKYNPALNDPYHSKMSFTQWSQAVNAGATDFKKDDHIGIQREQRNRFMQALFGNNIDLTEAVSEGISQQELKAEHDRAKKEADNLNNIGKITAGNQERHNIAEANMAGLLGKASAPAEKFFNAMNGFLDHYGEMTLIAEAVIGLTAGLGSWSAVKMLGKGGKVGAGLLGVATRKVTRVAEKGLDIVGRNLWKGEAGGAFGIAYELTGGIMPSTSDHDTVQGSFERSLNDPEQIRFRKKLHDIEKSLNSKVSIDDGKLILTDKHGNSIVFTEDETITSIRERMKQKIEGNSHPSAFNHARKNEQMKQKIGGNSHPSAFNHARKNEQMKQKIGDNSHHSGWQKIIPFAHVDELTKAHAHASIGKMTDYQRNNARIMMSILMKEGQYSRDQAIGIIASTMGESGLNPQAVGDHGTSFGIAQWHTKERKEAFKKLFGHDIQHSTLEEQVRFLIWELKHTFKKAGDAIRKARTPVEAMTADVNYFEVPANKEREKIRRVHYISGVSQAVSKPSVVPNSMDYDQLQWQGKASQIQRQVHNSTVNNQAGNTTQTMTNTINIDARGGNMDKVKKSVQEALHFPNASTMNGISGVV